MPALVIRIGNIFRAVGRESHRQNPVQGIVGVLRDCPGRGNTLDPVAGAVIVIDRCPGVRVAFLDHVAESIINIGRGDAGGSGNGQRAVMRIIACRRDCSLMMARTRIQGRATILRLESAALVFITALSSKKIMQTQPK